MEEFIALIQGAKDGKVHWTVKYPSQVKGLGAGMGVKC